MLLLLLFVGGLFGPAVLWPGFVRNELFGLVPQWWLGAAVRPVRFDLVPLWATPLTAAVFQGGLAPLVGAVLTLELVGPTVERAVGSIALLLLLAVSAYLSGLVQVGAEPSQTPILGSAGMLSGLIGAALLLRGRTRMRVSLAPFHSGLTVPAVLLLAAAEYLLWRSGAEVVPRDLVTPANLEACAAGLVTGLVSAALWRLFRRLPGALLPPPAEAAGAPMERLRLALFPWILIFLIAWPALIRIARFR